MVGVSAHQQAAMNSAGIPAPQGLLASMLVDTGASHTNVCKSVLSRLGLTPKGFIDVHTPSTGSAPHKAAIYDVAVAILGRTPFDSHWLPAIQVTESDFTVQGIQGLIGRDILSRGRLTYSGPDQIFYLSF